SHTHTQTHKSCSLIRAFRQGSLSSFLSADWSQRSYSSSSPHVLLHGVQRLVSWRHQLLRQAGENLGWDPRRRRTRRNTTRPNRKTRDNLGFAATTSTPRHARTHASKQVRTLAGTQAIT